jgi:undecaprenyl-diphosphatase
MSIKHALLVGLFQGLAITPGISRSGATILIALYLGYAKNDAAEFSFLISIPAVLGASFVTFHESTNLAHVSPGPLWAGFLSSGVVGFLVIFALLKMIRRGQFHAVGDDSFFVGLVAFFYGLV